MLYRSEKFDNIVFLYAEYLFGKAVKGIFVGLLSIELFQPPPSIMREPFGILR